MSNDLSNCELKTITDTINVLKIKTCDIEKFETSLEKLVASAPNFFNSLAVVVDISCYSNQIDDHKLDIIASTIGFHGMFLIGFSGVNEALEKERIWNKPIFKGVSMLNKLDHIQPIVQEKSVSGECSYVHPKSVRGGQKLYKESQSIVVIGSVNRNAEVIAGGNVIVRGALSGNVCAGASGDKSAIIVADSFNANMVTIGGLYMHFKDNVPENIRGESVMIRVDDNKLTIIKS
jgi:septum site-determining protein MinC